MVNSLPEVLKGHLAKHGWSFKRLAKEAGLPPNTIHWWTTKGAGTARRWQQPP